MGYVVAFIIGFVMGGFTIITVSVVQMEKDERKETKE